MRMSVIKDSGERREFETGSVRDMAEGKGRFDLIPYLPQENLAKHYEAGIKKYGERNWEKGQPLQAFLDSGLRHFLKFMSGARDEDHLSASVWNNYGYQWTENEIIEGRLPAYVILYVLDWASHNQYLLESNWKSLVIFNSII